MRAGTRRAAWSVVLISLMVLVAGSATSYIDGNSGSYLIQLIVGGAVGAALAVKVFWRRIWTFFGAKLSRKA
jgi:hypothetical protein